MQQIYMVNVTRPNPVVISASANIGVSTYFYKKHPNTKILAFETLKKRFPWFATQKNIILYSTHY